MTTPPPPSTKCYVCGTQLPTKDGYPDYWLGTVMQESGIPLSVRVCEKCAPPRLTGKTRRIVESEQK